MTTYITEREATHDSTPASDMTRSTGGSSCFVAPRPVERDPRMHWMAERSKQKERVHLSQAMVLQYGWSCFDANKEASLL